MAAGLELRGPPKERDRLLKPGLHARGVRTGQVPG